MFNKYVSFSLNTSAYQSKHVVYFISRWMKEILSDGLANKELCKDVLFVRIRYKKKKPFT